MLQGCVAFNQFPEETTTVTAATAQLTMYTTPWCGYCRQLKRLLARDDIDFAEVDIEQDPAAADYVMSVNGGNQTVPTVVFPDGTALTNPSLAQVKDHLDAVS
ncbi:MAG: mycoredoxin [Streptosporangiales bacterium]|nr:mycoredoxin [Streptosporangiales bacterium]